MSSPIGSDSNSAAPASDASTQPSKEATNPAAGGGSSGGFSSLGDLQKKEPEFFNLLVTGMMTAFCQQQKDQYDRIKQRSKEYINGG